MQREYALIVAALALLVVSALAGIVVPGVLAERSDDIRPSRVGLRDDVTISPHTVTGETVHLSLDMRLEHRGGPAENVTVLVRAIDEETGLQVTTKETSVGTITGENEVPVRANLTIPREGGYNFRVVVYQNGRREASGTTSVSGVGSLRPEYAETSVQFERFDGAGIPTITYTIANTTAGTAELSTHTHLTNTGDASEQDLTLVLFARQAESNIIADRRRVEVETIRPGRTRAVSANLSVPDDYNYRLDAILQRDGVILGVASATAELAPTQPLPENRSRERVDIRASDFQREDQGNRDESGAVATRTTEAAGPGFTAGVGILAVLVVTILSRRIT